MTTMVIRQRIKTVGLVMDLNEYEYLLVLLHAKDPAIRIEHMNVTNVSQRKYAVSRLQDFHPEIIFFIDSRREGIAWSFGH